MVRSARPSAFFSRHSSSTSLSAPQSVDSGLQVPWGPLVVSGAATSLATGSVESGVVEPSASVAESSTAATGPATGSHQIDYCRTALVADQSHKVCCTPTQHTVRWEWETCVQSSFPASFVCAVKTIFLLRTTGGSPAPDPLRRLPPPPPPPPPWKLAGKCRTMGAEGARSKFCLN